MATTTPGSASEAQRVLATYWIETAYSLEEAAEVLAGEQSSGTFVAVPGETDELRRRFRARVDQLEPLDVVEQPSLPGAQVPGPGPYRRGRVTVSFPLENMGTNLPTLLSTVAGNLFELREFSGLKLVGLELPDAFAAAHAPPKFGIEGTRHLCGVFERPLIGTIIKPSVGLSPVQTAELAGQLAAADIDFIKDDELMADPPHSPLAQRVEKVMAAIDAQAQRSGRKVMYAFNITDSLDQMRRHHDCVVAAGGSCVMVSLNSVGLAGVDHLRNYCQLPIHGHRNGWGMYNRHPALGLDFSVYQKLWRLAGVDHLHVNGLQNKFWEPDDSVVGSAQACLTPLFGGYETMPVFSSGQWGGQAPETFRRLQSVDLIYLAGGGIMAHPGGPGAGSTAIRQAWAAAVAGVDLATWAKDHPPLRQALEKFAKKVQ